MKPQSVLEEDFEVELQCIRVRQPIGDFYVASIDSATLVQITLADVRRIYGDREVDTYLGIQREVNRKRVQEIGQYVNTVDACFPTAIILAVDRQCALFDEGRSILKLRTSRQEPEDDEYPHRDGIAINRIQIAKVLDGQHRIEGLKGLEEGHPPFQLNVSIFVDMDIESQAYLFSIVNLAQTKVSKSLVYDLFEYARARSPQKTCHNIAVALNTAETSPFLGRIKRLGVATEGVFTETLTQATFVEALLPYITRDRIGDRDSFMRGKTPKLVSAEELDKTPFRNMFLADRDLEIADVLFNYFGAVRDRWPDAWIRGGSGFILNKTNGFNALMRLLRPVYLMISGYDGVPPKQAFAAAFARSTMTDDNFTTQNFKPGTSGAAELFHRLSSEMLD